ncbi:GNAT family N-acetyltransferase [Mammaliicoccus sciuri]|uniref:GNAT family N-acetyltransferase n=1 Tax=Mammaliicoccus sciuri TaxID=1296 RepID=UPI002DB64CFC|nr:GNAT family N-acetyltransferase [Mammaliicoccus sciuri]MEB7436571.1 GNAT family N-acetyltransferase [Mammaliicoccus sciuri]MEB8294538.1 GNAT family N-acetyltransferase [Mammaliicoccus sciuri]
MKYRNAVEQDLIKIVNLLKDDFLGENREYEGEILDDKYRQALVDIEKQEGNNFIVVEKEDHIVACFQLTIIPSLSRSGTKRAQIESVRVKYNLRGQGIGKEIIREAIHMAKIEGCGLIQLTSDKQRIETHKFYEKLGFESSHYGYKYYL